MAGPLDRAPRGPLELGGRLLVGAEHGGGVVPGAAVGVLLAGQHVGQRAMRAGAAANGAAW